MNAKFPKEAQPIKLYRTPKSGHCHRVELMMALLDLPYETIDLDMANAAHKAPDYLVISPFGQVPAIDDNGTTLSDSNGILIYLISRYGDGYDWLPSDPITAANVQRWLSVAAGEIAYGPCAARLVTVFGVELDLENAKSVANHLLGVMDKTLASTNFLVGEAITVADVAGYTYVAHAPEGGVSLKSLPNVKAWIKRIEAQPRFVGMATSPLLA